MPIQAVIFDHGGVLSRGGVPGTNKRAIARAMGLEPDEIDISDLDYELKLGRIHTDDFLYAIHLRYPDAPKRVTFDVWDEIHRELRPDPDVYDFASRCRGAGLRVGILSTIGSYMADRLRQDGSYADFDPVVLSCDIQAKKPDYAAFRAVELGLPGIARAEILFFDDQRKHVASAINHGWKAVWVDRSMGGDFRTAQEEALVWLRHGGVNI